MNDVLRRLEQDCGYEEEMKAFLLDLGLDRSRGNQPGGYNLSGPQMDRVLRVSFNLTVNAHYTNYTCFLRIGGKPDFIGQHHWRQRPGPWTLYRRLLPLPEADERGHDGQTSPGGFPRSHLHLQGTLRSSVHTEHPVRDS